MFMNTECNTGESPNLYGVISHPWVAGHALQLAADEPVKHAWRYWIKKL